MGQSRNYNNDEEIAYLADFPGADPVEDQIFVAVNDIPEPIRTVVSDALVSEGEDALLVRSDNPLDVSAAEVDIDIASHSGPTLTVTDDGNLAIATWDAGTLPTEQQSDISIEDSQGSTIDPAEEPDHPESQTVGHDLAVDGDLSIGPLPVAKTSGVVISANSTDGNGFSVSVLWEDGNGNEFQSESSADIGLDGITQDWARLVRKGPQVSITVTDTSGAANNNVNVHVDSER